MGVELLTMESMAEALVAKLEEAGWDVSVGNLFSDDTDTVTVYAELDGFEMVSVLSR